MYKDPRHPSRSTIFLMDATQKCNSLVDFVYRDPMYFFFEPRHRRCPIPTFPSGRVGRARNNDFFESPLFEVHAITASDTFVLCT